MSAPKKSSEMMAELRKRRRLAGLHEILVWVPRGKAHVVKGHAYRLCNEHLTDTSDSHSLALFPEPE